MTANWQWKVNVALFQFLSFLPQIFPRWTLTMVRETSRYT